MLAPRGIHVIRDPHIGTGISNTLILDWGRLSALQVSQDHPDAVVVFIGVVLLVILSLSVRVVQQCHHVAR